jgi:hypothetical protein
VIICFALAGGLAGAVQAGAPFTRGNLVVVQVGDGSAALSSAATPVFLAEYRTDGTFLPPLLPLPTAVSGDNRRLTNSGTATSEGYLSLSIDGRYLLQTGYDAAVGTASVASTSVTAVNRVIGRTALDGTIDTTTVFSTIAYNQSNIRSAASVDGSAFWASGAGAGGSGGVWYTLLGPESDATVQISTSVTNTRNVKIFGGQLYVSSMSGSFRGVNKVGEGLPTTGGQTITLLPGFDPNSNSPQSVYDYFFANDTTLYVADDRAAANGGGIQKWTYDGQKWVLTYTLNAAPGGPVRGLTGYVDSQGRAVLFATTTESSANRIVTVTDTGPGAAFTTLATAASNTVLRGIVYLPPEPCVGPTITDQPDSANVCAGEPVLFSVTASGTEPISYQWRKDGQEIQGATESTYAIPNPGPGDAGSYDCVVSNACGSVTSDTASLTVRTAPAITDSPDSLTVEAGDPAVFVVVATGEGLNYQWRRDGQNLTDNERISGSQTATLTISSTLRSDAGEYDVVVTNDCGSVISEAARLTVTCLGDVNGDGTVGQSDLATLLANFNTEVEPNTGGDLNGDGFVDQADLAALLANFGKVCP